jgi:hypothetical protein
VYDPNGLAVAQCANAGGLGNDESVIMLSSI